MKRNILLALGLALLTVAPLRADLITLWDFNSPDFDFDDKTGTTAPAVGAGQASAIGGVVNSTTNSLGADSSDPNTADNTKWRFATFPGQGNGNKTAGAEFKVNTTGYENITLNWDHYNSATASKNWRIQYTTNGTDFIDHTPFAIPASVTWANGSFTSLAGIPGVRNNPNFGVRIVSEFVSTATGSGANQYVSAGGGSYSTGGTLWLDMVYISGTPIDGNTHPVISSINTQTTRVDTASATIPFTVSDAQTASSSLTVSAVSYQPLIANTFTFGGSGNNRTLIVTPEAGQTGTAEIVVTVSDNSGKVTDSKFTLVVLASNTPPTIAAVGNHSVVVNTVTNIPLTVSDLETPNQNLTYTVESFNSYMIPPSIFQVVGSGSSLALRVSPTESNLGSSRIRLIVSDGTFSSTNLFTVKVVRPQTVTIFDFNSNPADNTAATGSYLAQSGSGTATNVANTASFGILGSGNVDGRTTDPAAIADNTTLRMATFPVQNTSNKTAGIQLNFSTVGYQNISITWDQQNSSSASRYWRVQYAADGVNFVDHNVYTNLLDGTTFSTGTHFTGIGAVNNNPNLAIRIVSEWESTIDVTSTNGFRGVQASGGYGTGGTLWTDYFVITGEAYVNTEPATLTVARSGNNVQISWPSTVNGVLQSAANVTGTYADMGVTPTDAGGTKTVTVTATGNHQFFRLRQ